MNVMSSNSADAKQTPTTQSNLFSWDPMPSFSWLFGQKPRTYSGILFGLDDAGKTTLLYQLKLGHDVQAIPTMVFNNETVDISDGVTFDLWDIGGCDQMRPLVKSYIKQDYFAIFVHDCHDQARLDEALAELQTNLQMIREVGARRLWVLLNKQDLLSPAESYDIVNNVRQRFQHTIATHGNGLVATVLALPGLSAKTGHQLQEAMRIIQRDLAETTLPDLGETSGSKSRDNGSIVRQGSNDEELLDRALKSNSVAEDADSFWAAFITGQLDAWDHYSHLRSGYFVLLEGLAAGKGLMACSDSFLEHLERLRNLNPQRFRNTAHRTMTVFWLVQLMYCTKIYQTANGMDDLPKREDFGAVLSQSPFLLDTHLWQQYYTKEVLFSAEAKQSWLPPSLKPLPAIVQPETNSTHAGSKATGT